ncbi:MAG: ubiquinone/menaquinone biosynthesis C-methylase UbiE [Cellvibrionaceae bacterium]|jgi:ubiquinone/menaquinone biosynthesis C-methylase UbiE
MLEFEDKEVVMSKKKVQEMFGGKADAYAISQVHAKGASLQRLVELIQPQAEWVGIDIATAAGHTAHILAPHLATMIATDITIDMLPKAISLAADKKLGNVEAAGTDAENLAFSDQSFDLVVCRIAPHHFPDIPRFVSEAWRVLRPNGVFAVVDNVVPSTGSKKKKDQAAYTNAADFVNAFEKLRDPSHAQCYSLHQWVKLFKQVGFHNVRSETGRKRMEFAPWADRMHVAADDKIRLKAMLVQAPNIVKEFLTPEFDGDKIFFTLTEGIIIGIKD